MDTTVEMMEAGAPFFRGGKSHRLWPAAPFKGLNFYTSEDAPLFCERESDVNTCGKIAAHFSTKLLILHGRTGAGKSSFIRAGLFPRYFAPDSGFFCLRDYESGEPMLIRSGRDPVTTMADALRLRLGRDDAELGMVGAELRRQASTLLDFNSLHTPEHRAEALLEVLRQISAQLPGTLVLAIDQAEEIFTLSTDSSQERIRRAYFQFLEALCFDQFDIKLLLVLRTEVYGQFADRFRFEPDLSISTVRTGLTHFMLHGIREPARLEQAILRPTSKVPVAGMPTPPFSHYGFEFTDGLAQRIAKDVIAHSGESSTLPILQLVCFDLYKRAREANRLHPDSESFEISHTLYDAHGGVKGAIDRFVRDSIADSVKCVRKLGPTDREMERWLEVLSHLVARQEGGALTSLLLPERELIGMAPSIPNMSGCLKAMARADVRLLRTVMVKTGSTTEPALLSYSLGHDCLAPSLFRDDETRRRIETTRRRGRLIAFSSAIGAALLAALVWTIVTWQQAKVSTTLAYAGAEPQAKRKLLTLLKTEAESIRLLRPSGVYRDLDDTLRTQLIRSPISAFEAARAAVSDDGDEVAAVVSEDYSPTSKSAIRLSLLGPRSHTSTVSIPQEAISASSLAELSGVAVGFIDGQRAPVVFDRGFLKYGNSSNSVAPVDVAAAAGDARVTKATAVEMTAGLLRLVSDDGSARFEVAINQRGTLPSNAIAVRERFWATLSPMSGWIAKLDGTNLKLVTTRGGGEGMKEWDLESQLHKEPFPGFVPSLTFVSDGAEVMIRDGLTKLLLVRQRPPNDDRPGPETIRFKVDGGLITIRALLLSRTVDLSATGSRPPMAVAKLPTGYRVAWISDDGVTVLESKSNEQHTLMPILHDLVLKPNEKGQLTRTSIPTLLTSLNVREGLSRLQFSRDGRFLSLIQQTPWGSGVHVWDLSDDRRRRIELLPARDMSQEVCRHLSFVPDGAKPRNEIDTEDVVAIPALRDYQPCKITP